jgi:hypothetical protein
MTSEQPKPSLLILLTSHWITMLGVALVTLAGFSWLFLLPAHVRARVDNPYIGLVVFLAIPLLFFLGLALIPIGIALTRRRWAAHLDTTDRGAARRRAAIFFAGMTLANLLIGSQLTYWAVAHMETVKFCGQSCHVMKPEFTAHQRSPHQAVECVRCHVETGARGWIRSKVAGIRQLKAVTFNTFDRPIKSAMESNRLVSSAETCQQCHYRAQVTGDRLRVFTSFKDDEANTRSDTLLIMRVGGGSFGGIHGAHLGSGVRIRYAVADAKRQTIPWVEYRNQQTGVVRTYLASDAKPESISTMRTFEMQCADCHNRPSHAFELPGRAVDEAILTVKATQGLPSFKKAGVDLLQAEYGSQLEAGKKIPEGLMNFYAQKFPEVRSQRAADIEAAGNALVAIYQRNVFPDLKVTWGTYANNLGHNDFPGCFRCHDESHTSSDNKTITQDCATCHEILTDEASVTVLKNLGVSDRIAAIQKQ